MKNIYVSTDFLQVSDSAMNFAAELARKTGALLTVIHAYQYLPPDSDTFMSLASEQYEELRKRTENELMEWCQTESVKSAFKYKVILKDGTADKVISEIVNEQKPDLLIMGTRKSSPLDKMIFGSVSGKVVRDVMVPILVIPNDYSYKPFSKIVYASDIHDSDIKNLNKLIEFAKLDQADITVLHVTNFNEEDSKYDIQYFMDLQKDIVKEVEYPNIKFDVIHGVNFVKVLNKYAELTDAYLLVMEQTKKDWFERLFDPSATQRQIYTMGIPTLFYKPNENNLN